MRQTHPAMWALALVGSVLLHAAAAALIVLPWAGFQRPGPPPLAEDLIIQVIPEAIVEPGTDKGPQIAADPEVIPPEPGEELAANITPPEEIPATEPAEPVQPDPPEEIPATEAEPAEPVQPDSVEEIPAEPAEPVQPVQAETVTPEAAPIAQPVAIAAPASAQPVAPVAPSAAVVAAQPLVVSPLRPEEGAPGGGGPVAPAPLSPITAAAMPGIISTAVPSAPVIVAALPPPVVPVAQPRPQPQPGGGAAAPDTPASLLVRRIRDELAVPCLVALPRQDAEGTLSMDYIAASEADIIAFSASVMEGATTRPPERRILVDPRQCPALNYVRSATRYPGSPIGLGLAAGSVPSGESLQGALRNAGGRYVSVLLIDADGVVQDLSGFMSFAGPVVQFDAPVTRNGDPRDTAQLVLALATDTRPAALDTHIGRRADEFFAALNQTAGPSTLMAVQTFVVE